MAAQKGSSRHERSKATQAAMMRAAETLIAEQGIENVSIRDIVAASGQKNESALQYHFKSFSGLLEAIHDERSSAIQAKRTILLAALLSKSPKPELRQICMLMVQPTFDLAQVDVDFRRYVRAFGHTLALTETSSLSITNTHGGGGPSGLQIGNLLRDALPHLDDEAYRRRMEAAVRLCAASMYHQAGQKNAFQGLEANLFLNNLIDGLAGLLSAPVSKETAALTRQAKGKPS